MTRAAVALAALLVALTACGAPDVEPGDLLEEVAAADPGSVIHVAAGRLDGPVRIDKPLTIVADGLVIEAPEGGVGLEIVDTAEVSVSGVSIEGGAVGVRVAHAADIALHDINVVDAGRHGILVENAHASISNCRVDNLLSFHGRGVEIRNAELRGESLVRSCVVVGPVFEGIVSRLSHVRFSGNTVMNATESGIAITEMSHGSIEASTVSGGSGAGILCGDMSACEIHGNTVRGTDGLDGRLSSAGHGVVVQYHSVATVTDLLTRGLAGEPVFTSLNGVVSTGE